MPDVNGNKDAVKLLEDFAGMAKREQVGYSLVVTAKEPGVFSAGFSGTVELERAALEGVKKVQTQLEENILNRTVPDPDPTLDASYVCYNVTCSPLSFDFQTWMVDKEMARVRAGAPGPLKVGFWYGRDGKTGINSGGSDNRELMFQNVVLPSLKLIGATEDPIATKGPFKEFFSYRDIVAASKAGEQVPTFKSGLESDIGQGYVTITLREASYWPERNSKIPEWTRFARYLQAKGERVIILRDTAFADEPLEDFETNPKASRDLLYRMCVYENAKCNLFVSNGPVSLAFFSKTPWLKFFSVDSRSPYNAGTPEYWKTCAGISPGEQFPWSGPKQRIVWKPDFYTNMVVAWDELWRDSV